MEFPLVSSTIIETLAPFPGIYVVIRSHLKASPHRLDHTGRYPGQFPHLPPTTLPAPRCHSQVTLLSYSGTLVALASEKESKREKKGSETPAPRWVTALFFSIERKEQVAPSPVPSNNPHLPGQTPLMLNSFALLVYCLFFELFFLTYPA